MKIIGNIFLVIFMALGVACVLLFIPLFFFIVIGALVTLVPFFLYEILTGKT